MRSVIVSVAFLALVAFSGAANASILGDLISGDGVVDSLQDDSRSNLHDTGTSGFSVGDVVYGFVNINTANLVDISPKNLAILYAAEIKSVLPVTAAAPNGGFVLGASSVAGWTLSDLITDSALDPQVDASIAPAGVTTANAVFVIVANNGGPSPTAPLYTSLDDFTSADWTYEMTGGIDPASSDFFQFAFVGFAGILGTEAAGFSVFDHVMGPTTLLPVSNGRLDGLPDSTHDVTLFNGQVYNNKIDPTPVAWTYTDNTQFQINAIPEPASVVAWCLFTALGGVGLYRRRK